VTLNGITAIILRYFAEFGSFGGQLHTRCSAIAERPRCRCGSFGRQYFADRSIFNNCDIGLQSQSIGWKKRKITAIRPFKFIQDHQGRYQSKACMRLPISD